MWEGGMEGDVDESSVPIIYNLIFNIPYTCIPHVWNGNVSYRLVMSAIVRMRAWHAHATYPAPENFSINAEFSRKHGKAADRAPPEEEPDGEREEDDGAEGDEEPALGRAHAPPPFKFQIEFLRRPGGF